MKNIVLASLLGFGLISSAWATETVNIHDRVNNAQAPAHQMQSAAAPVGLQGTAPRMTAGSLPSTRAVCRKSWIT